MHGVLNRLASLAALAPSSKSNFGLGRITMRLRSA